MPAPAPAHGGGPNRTAVVQGDITRLAPDAVVDAADRRIAQAASCCFDAAPASRHVQALEGGAHG